MTKMLPTTYGSDGAGGTVGADGAVVDVGVTVPLAVGCETGGVAVFVEVGETLATGLTFALVLELQAPQHNSIKASKQRGGFFTFSVFLNPAPKGGLIEDN